MIKILKKIIKYSVFGLFLLSSCSTNFNTENFKKFDIENFDTNNYSENKNEKFLNQILDRVYRNNILEKMVFLEKQNNSQNKNKFYQSLYDIQKKENYSLEELGKILSENWYLVLKNIDKFYLRFYNWYIIPEKNLGNNKISKISNKYLDSLKKLKKYNDFFYKNNDFHLAKESSESLEINNYSNLFIPKDESLLNLKIQFIDNEPLVTLSPLVYFFGNSEKDLDNLFLNLFSEIYHQANIHGIQDFYNLFEHSLVKELKYHEPALMQMVLKNEEKNSEK